MKSLNSFLPKPGHAEARLVEIAVSALAGGLLVESLVEDGSLMHLIKVAGGAAIGAYVGFMWKDTDLQKW